MANPISIIVVTVAALVAVATTVGAQSCAMPTGLVDAASSFYAANVCSGVCTCAAQENPSFTTVIPGHSSCSGRGTLTVARSCANPLSCAVCSQCCRCTATGWTGAACNTCAAGYRCDAAVLVCPTGYSTAQCLAWGVGACPSNCVAVPATLPPTASAPAPTPSPTPAPPLGTCPQLPASTVVTAASWAQVPTSDGSLRFQVEFPNYPDALSLINGAAMTLQSPTTTFYPVAMASPACRHSNPPMINVSSGAVASMMAAAGTTVSVSAVTGSTTVQLSLTCATAQAVVNLFGGRTVSNATALSYAVELSTTTMWGCGNGFCNSIVNGHLQIVRLDCSASYAGTVGGVQEAFQLITNDYKGNVAIRYTSLTATVGCSITSASYASTNATYATPNYCSIVSPGVVIECGPIILGNASYMDGGITYTLSCPGTAPRTFVQRVTQVPLGANIVTGVRGSLSRAAISTYIIHSSAAANQVGMPGLLAVTRTSIVRSFDNVVLAFAAADGQPRTGYNVVVNSITASYTNINGVRFLQPITSFIASPSTDAVQAQYVGFGAEVIAAVRFLYGASVNIFGATEFAVQYTITASNAKNRQDGAAVNELSTFSVFRLNEGAVRAPGSEVAGTMSVRARLRNSSSSPSREPSVYATAVRATLTSNGGAEVGTVVIDSFSVTSLGDLGYLINASFVALYQAANVAVPGVSAASVGDGFREWMVEAGAESSSTSCVSMNSGSAACSSYAGLPEASSATTVSMLIVMAVALGSLVAS